MMKLHMRDPGSFESEVNGDWDGTEVLGLDNGPVTNDGVDGNQDLVSGDAMRAFSDATEEHSIKNTSAMLAVEDDLEDFFEDKVGFGFDGVTQ